MAATTAAEEGADGEARREEAAKWWSGENAQNDEIKVGETAIQMHDEETERVLQECNKGDDGSKCHH